MPQNGLAYIYDCTDGLALGVAGLCDGASTFSIYTFCQVTTSTVTCTIMDNNKDNCDV
jgi:hypothetical protein